jgi:serine/threonine protein kinase
MLERIFFQSLTGREPVFDSLLSLRLIDLLRKLLQSDRTDRITLLRVREHPWLSLILYEALGPVLSKPMDVEILHQLTKIGQSPKAFP